MADTPDPPEPGQPTSPPPPPPSCKKTHYRNPPERVNPDPVTLRDQWRYATRQYSRWYSSAWGAAILAGTAFFALGWVIKGGNPLPSKSQEHGEEGGKPPAADA